jgi:predicted P-loop ATPase
MSNAFDSAQLWLNGLVWDGKERVEGFMRDYMGTEDTEYTRSVSRYMWTALAGRVLCPGVKADMVPIYIGKQGAGKSTAVAALSPSREFFGEISLSDKDAELGRKIRGKLVTELPELKGLKGKDMEHIKAFITRTDEENRKLYKEYYQKYNRRNVFFGTTNEDEFLSDDTGHRRWLPVEVGVVRDVDVGAIVMDCAQLWAEAREIYLAAGVEYAAAEMLGRDVHDNYVLTDPWQTLLEEWLVTPRAIDGYIPEKDGVILSDFITDVLKIDDKNISRREQMRVSSILKRLGYVTTSCRKSGRVVRRWLRVK